MTREALAAELALPLTNDDGWGDDHVLVRRKTLAAYLELAEAES